MTKTIKTVAIGFGIAAALTMAACGGKNKGGTTPTNGSGSAMAPMGGQGYGGSAAPAMPATPPPASGGAGY